MIQFLKEFMCKHEYKFVGRIQSYWLSDSGETHIIDTDLLECKHCGKRKVLYTYKYLTLQLIRKYLPLWVKREWEVPKDWFEPLPKVRKKKVIKDEGKQL